MSRSMATKQPQIRALSSAVWAVDPAERDLKIDSGTLAEVAEWTSSGRMVVHPVYVFTPATEFEEFATEAVTSAVQDYIEPLVTGAEKADVIVRRNAVAAGVTESLLTYADERGADLIVVSSHGRRGVPRLLFGSFAERLLHSSKLPVLFLNHNARPPGVSMKRALFATDFSSSSGAAFDRFLKEAKGLVTEIVLFNDFSVATEMALFAPRWGYSMPAGYGFIEAQLEAIEAASAVWIRKAQQAGFVAVYAQRKDGAPVAHSILEAARSSSIGLVVMSADIGPFRALVLGNYARDMIHASEFPVLLYGPNACGGGES